MSKYIDREELIKKLFPIGMVENGNYTINAKAVRTAIDSVPTADVVEVVRCKDCKNYKAVSAKCGSCYTTTYIMHPDDFCSQGKRREKNGKRTDIG